MGQADDRIKKDLIEREERLLDNNVRTDAARVRELVGDSCIEISAAGKQRTYKGGDVFSTIQGVMYIDSNDVRMTSLSDDCKLLVYTAAQVVKNTRVKTSCSSIWKKQDGDWKIVFHQDTAETVI